MSAKKTAQEPTNTPATETPSLGSPSTSTALITLFEKAANHLEPHELEYMARLDEIVDLEVGNMTSVLMSIGCLFNNTEEFGMPGKSRIADMFLSLSNQMDTINGLLFVSSEAAFKLKQAKQPNQQA